MRSSAARPLLLHRGIPIVIGLSYGALALTPDLRTAVLLWPVVGTVVALLGFALWSERHSMPRWSPRLVLLLALAFRLLFLFRAPELSDDIYRYVWDGAATLSGQNPYALAPADASPRDPAMLRLRSQVNHPDLVTIYPPAAQLVFAAGRALGHGVLGMKALLVAFDLASCLVLLRLLRRAELPPWRLALYAWHPLPILEIGASGHIDIAGVLALLVSFALLVRPQRDDRADMASGAAFACAVMTKLFPLALLPSAVALASRWGRRGVARFIGAFVVVALLLVLPFWAELGNGIATLSTYAHRWEFGSYSFRTLRVMLGDGERARRVLGVLFVVAALLVYRSRLRRDNDPSRLLRAALHSAYVVSLAFLFLSPTLHPWYALYLVALLPFAAEPVGLCLSGSVFLGYFVLRRFAIDGAWFEPGWVAGAIVLVPFVAFLGQLALRARRRHGKDAPAHRAPQS